MSCWTRNASRGPVLAYVLEIDQERIEGQTTAGGEVIQPIPPNAKAGRLILGDGGEEFVLDLRHLDPDDEATGLQGRLRNLGYDPGEIDGRVGPATQAAISQFQRDQGLEVTGEPDQPTLDKPPLGIPAAILYPSLLSPAIVVGNDETIELLLGVAQQGLCRETA